MKRIIVLLTAVGVLVAAASAYAAINTYSGTNFTFNTKKAGSAKKPVPLSFTENIKVTPGTAGSRAGVLLNIKTTIYGEKSDGKDFPTCSIAKIDAAGNDTVCPKKARVASGYINALLGSATNFTAAGVACDPNLDVWNGGQGKLVFFFVPTGAGTPHACLGGGIAVGVVGAYPGTYKNVGKNLVTNVPVPTSVNYPVGGLVGSLQAERLVFTSQSSKGHLSMSSIGCTGKKRPYSYALTSTLPGQHNEVDTVKGSGAC